MPSLVFRSGSRQGTTFSFDHTIIVGRGRTVDVALDDASVSRRHATLVIDEGTCRVTDLGSANGTQLNGRPVSAPTLVHDGDTLAFGTVQAVYRADARPPAPTPGAAADVRCVEEAEGQVLHAVPAERPHDEDDQSQVVRRALKARLEFLDRLSQASDLIFDEARLMDFVLGHVFATLPQAERACIVEFDAATREVRPLASRAKRGEAGSSIAVSRTLIADVLSRREAVLVADATIQQRWRGSESFVLHGIRSAICVPLVFSGEVYGVLQIDNGRSPMPFELADLNLLRAVGYQLAMSLAYARLHGALVERSLVEHDLQLARKVQQHFLPEQVPTVAGYGFTVDYVPALGVSGDFYDFLQVGPGRIGLVIGDVSGKGVSAALYAARVSSDLRYVAAGSSEPGALLSALNRRFAALAPEGMFVTMALVVLDAATGRLSVANAGHPHPLLRSATGEVARLGRTGGPPIGVTEDVDYAQVDHDLAPGEAVVLYTDGVSEAMNVSRELFGEASIERVLTTVTGNAEVIRRTMMTALHDFVGSAGFSDDVTLMCASREP